MSATATKYPTKQLDCWKKGKELRLEHYLDLADAKGRGKVLVSGTAGGCVCLPAGLGDFVFLSGEPYGASMSADHEFSIKCMEAAESRGYARDMCAYMRNYWGSMFLDQYYFTKGPWPKPDFVLTSNFCDSGHAKWYQVVQDFEHIPVFGIDEPTGAYPLNNKGEARDEYMVGQFLDSIEWMEKVTGKKYDDEKLITALKNFFKTESIWGEICLMNAAVPAPIDLKSLMALMPVSMLRRHETCAVEFMKELRDEMKDRVANGIAGVGDERFRLATNAPPPWPFLKMFRYFETFGVVFVGTQTYVMLCGAVEYKENGVFPVKPPEEQGWPEMKNREDAIRTYVKWLEKYKRTQSGFEGCGFVGTDESRAMTLVNLSKHWKVDAIALQLNRGCPPMNLMLNFQKDRLIEAGFPVTIFEANFADIRDIDKAQLIDRVESFLESLGITKLERTRADHIWGS